MKRLQTTVCIVHQSPKVLLGMKKRGFGVGRWNGFGGKVEEGETIAEAVKREIMEEAGIEILDLEKIGIISFEFKNDAQALDAHFFKVKNFKGEPKESEEMKPEWFSENEIPFDQMWPDDKLWMPMFLAGKKFKGRFLFDKPSTKEEVSIILEEKLEEVIEL